MEFFWCFLFLLHVVEALFEDQVGKWDWRAQHFGCPVNTVFSRTSSGKDVLLFSTAKNVIVSVDSNSGAIIWRQVQEDVFTKLPQLQHDGNYVLSIVDGGRYMRLFDAETGTLKTQKTLGLQNLNPDHVAQVHNLAVVLDNNQLIAFEAGDSPVWSKKLDEKVTWLKVMTVGKLVNVIGKSQGGVLARRVFDVDGHETEMKQVETFRINNPVFSGSSIAELSGQTIQAIKIGEDGSAKLVSLKWDGEDLHGLGSNFYSSKQAGLSKFVEVTSNEIAVRGESAYTDVVTVAPAKNPVFALYYQSTKKVRVMNGKEQLEFAIGLVDQAPVKEIKVLVSDDGHQYHLLLVRTDCRIDFFEVNKNTRKPSLEWSRFEALASVSSVEMVDLPLSDSQATIEHEFGIVGGSLLHSFLLRVYGQSEQIRRSFVTFSHRLITSFQLLSSGQESISGFAHAVFGLGSPTTRRLRPGAFVSDVVGEVPMERDYFNMRKVLVLTTLQGSVYGIHNELGAVLWSIHLGTQFEPLRSQFSEEKVPLFIQRSTSHYQYTPQAAVAFNLKVSGKSRVVMFNPITGETLNSHTFNTLKRIELAPFINAEYLNPLLLIDSTDRLQFLPPLPVNFQPKYPLYLFFSDTVSGVLTGGKVNTTTNEYSNLWKSELNLSKDEKILLIRGKSPKEKVHSQGKVLGDRNVLYKYSNPNLVAIMTADSALSTITLYLVDSVTGQVIHVAKHDRATEPVHLLHCENWITYTYWNDKARRTEIGVLELYEGLEQTNVVHFNSYTTLKHPLDVISKSFVFPQGVSAIAATDTELGLTTRSVLIAMPFGGVMEVSRRFLDARRPVEMTAELREEMVVPYIPEIPIATEDLVNYNQSVVQVTGIRTAPSGLESTSLMLAYGMDMFYTRLTPSGTFDILKDDFDYILISIVMVALVVASFVCKRLARYQGLKQAWA